MTSEHRLQATRRLAWICALLMLLVTSISAGLRLEQPRPECSDWPVCRSLPVADAGPVSAAPSGLAVPLTLARSAHRITATLALLTSVALVLVALARRPRDWGAGGLSLALLGLALGLAALGIVTPGSRATAVLLGNLLGGLLMLSLAWRLTRRFAPRALASSGPGPAYWPLVAALLWTVQAALGAVSGAGDSFLASLAHLALSVAAGCVALLVGWLARRQGLRGEGTTLMVLVGVQWLLGGSTALLDAPMAMVLAHNIGAAIGLALLVGLIGRGPARA